MIKKKDFAKIYLYLFCLLIFLVPSNLFYKFFENTAYVNGILVDYLIPKIYLSDLVILILLGLWGIEGWQNLAKNKNKLKKIGQIFIKNKSLLKFTLIPLIFIFTQFYTKNTYASLWYLIKIVELSLLFLFIKKHPQLIKSPLIKTTILVTVAFQTILGIYQFQTQRSLFGFWFLGEGNLNQFYGIARGNFGGELRILPYGTTVHPNVLAGFLVLFFAIWLNLKNKQNSVISSITFIFAGYCLYLTQSISAWITLILIILIYIFRNWFIKQKKLIYITIFLISIVITPFIIHQLNLKKPGNLSLIRRDELNQAAITMTSDHYLIGVGLNNFTEYLDQYYQSREIVNFIQPVHHLGLLLISETGIFGLAALISLTTLLNPLISFNSLWILPIFCLDHYLLTSQTGLLLLCLIFSSKITKKHP